MKPSFARLCRQECRYGTHECDDSWEGALAECRMGPHVRLLEGDDFPIAAGVSDNYFDLLGH